MRRVAALLGLLLALPAVAGGQERGIALTAERVEIRPDRLAPGMRIAGAWHLGAEAPDFGGVSALLVEGGRLTAVTDRGHRLTATIGLAEPPVAGLVLAPLSRADGTALSGDAADAEGLARRGDTLFVSFERDHRIVPWRDGQPAPAIRPEGAAALPFNDGIEALATLPDGRILAIGEARGGAGFPLWLLAPEGAIARAALPATSRHAVTGADMGPDGRLYLLLRHWSRATGISVRVMAYALGPDGLPDPARALTLAEFGRDSGIDNMEGLAAVPDGAGGVLLWLIADDNFNPPQRTILMALGRAP